MKKNIILLLSMLSLSYNICPDTNSEHQLPSGAIESAQPNVSTLPVHQSSVYDSSSFTCMPRLIIAGGLVCATVGAILLLGPGGCSIPLISASTAAASTASASTLGGLLTTSMPLTAQTTTTIAISGHCVGAISMCIGGLFAYRGMNMSSYTVDDHEIVLH